MADSVPTQAQGCGALPRGRHVVCRQPSLPDPQLWRLRVMVVDESRFQVVIPIVLKQMTTIDALAKDTAVPQAEVESLVAQLPVDGAVIRIEDQVPPTEEGPAAVREHHATRDGALSSDRVVLQWAERYGAITKTFLETMSAWQQVPAGQGTIPKDHSDSSYDDEITNRMDGLITRVSPRLIDELSGRVPRLTVYESDWRRPWTA